MTINVIHTFLVHPLKGKAEPLNLSGTEVRLEGKLFTLLNQVYNLADEECDIDIAFSAAENGTQINECRDLLVAHLDAPSIATSRPLADRLASVTTRRSGMGLLFIICGMLANGHRKCVISRFPADSGILAEQNAEELSVAFIERVFMKSDKSYKAVRYSDRSLRGGFWDGRAVDRQINARDTQASAYWIHDFLKSDFKTTSHIGTRRLAVAIREALKHTDNADTQAEIASLAHLTTGLGGQTMSIDELIGRFALSDRATTLIRENLPNALVAAERFRFDRTEFIQQIALRSIRLDSGVVVTAPSGEFDRMVHREAVSGTDGVVRLYTEGHIVSERLTKKNV